MNRIFKQFLKTACIIFKTFFKRDLWLIRFHISFLYSLKCTSPLVFLFSVLSAFSFTSFYVFVGGP
jgi:hypothetical protein